MSDLQFDADGRNTGAKSSEDWASGKIESKRGVPVGFFLFFSVLAMALSTLAIWNMPKEWQKGNHAILIVLIFPVAAFCLLGYSFYLWRSRRHFGRCLLDLTRVPVPLGGVLEGVIQVGTRLKLEHGLHLKFSCVRRVVTTSGKNRSFSENVLWQDEKIYIPEASLPELEPGHTGIPVYFKLPDGQPQCFTRGDTSVYWRLEARAKMRGPDFLATFDVPVFHVAEAAVVNADADPTAALQMPIEEFRRDERSKIKVTDGPGGREFYFPPARNIGAATLTSLFALIFNVGAGFMFYFHMTIVFSIFSGLIGLIISCFAFSLWFKSSRVTIDSTGVRAAIRYLFFNRTRQFAAIDVARFETTSGMTSGSQAFMDIRLIPQTGRIDPRFRISDPRGVVIASGIASVAEANWIAQEMNRALRRQI
jgi:hypothetical protein